MTNDHTQAAAAEFVATTNRGGKAAAPAERVSVVQAAAHGLTAYWLVLFVLSWVTVLASSAVALPLMYPYQTEMDMVDNGIVIGLLIPIVVGSRFLDEGIPALVRTASRRLTSARCTWAVSYTAMCLAGGSLCATLLPVPTFLVIAVSGLLAALSVLGVALMGTRRGWIVPLGIGGLFSAPGVIPWEANLLYRGASSTTTAYVAVALIIAACTAYAYRGGR